MTIIEEKENLKSVCWNITSCCNDNCSFCYRDNKSPMLTLDENKEIANKLVEMGFNKISFVGGEPLLYNDLFILADYIKSIDSSIILSITTNAILLTEYNENINTFEVNSYLIEKILIHFDWVTLSIEGSNPKQQYITGRNENHFLRIHTILDYLNSNESIKIKINTFVSKKNITFLQDIAMLLSNYRIDRWKLMPFLPSRYSANKNQTNYFLDSNEYIYSIKKLLCNLDSKTLSISIDTETDYCNKYINISSDGKIISFNGKDYRDLINIKNETINCIKQKLA